TLTSSPDYKALYPHHDPGKQDCPGSEELLTCYLSHTHSLDGTNLKKAFCVLRPSHQRSSPKAPQINKYKINTAIEILSVIFPGRKAPANHACG
ncbi:hypothetical protein PGT21_017581, partial [Puccinia graminis f. sp. tritici]